MSRKNSNKSAAKSSTQATAEKKIQVSRAWLIPIAVLIAVVPLVTIIHVYDCGLEENPWFSIGGKLYDFFLYYKAWFIRLICILVFFSLAFLLPYGEHDILKSKKNIAPTTCIGIFCIFALISALLSDNKISAFFGGYEQFEGFFVLIGYVVCFYFAFGFVRTKKLMRFLLDALLIGSTLVGILGTFQAVGLDWIQSDWAKPILTTELMGKTDLSNFHIKLNFGKGMSYVTLYNPNYVGSYVALVLPYIIYLIIRGERIWRRILATICSILLVITLLASRSLTGILGLGIGAIVAAILLLPYLKKTRPVIVSGLVLVFAGVMAIVILQPAFFSKLFNGTEEYSIESMTTNDSSLNIRLSKGQDITLAMDKNTTGTDGWSKKLPSDVMKLTDSSGKEVSTWTDPSTGVATINAEGYYPLKFSLESLSLDDNAYATYEKEYKRVTGKESSINTVSDEDYLTDSGSSIDILHVTDWTFDWSFTMIDGKLMIYNDFGRLDELSDIRKSGFEGSYYFASRRGYIWSRTLPLLTDNLLTGVGADNFVYAFPNDDYVGKRYMGYDTQTITKPHNMYLQIWIQDGLPALIAFLALYLIFLIRVFRMSFGKNRTAMEKGIEKGSFMIVTAAATTAYLVVGMANDSTITVAPIYFVMLGIGYSNVIPGDS